MNALIINLNDTLTICDAAVAELVKASNMCQPCAEMAATSWLDVIIVLIICLTIVSVALIVQRGFLAWKTKETEAAKAERDARETDAVIAARIQKAEALGRLLDFIEKNTSTEEYSKDEEKWIRKQRDIASSESQYYINVLKAVAGGEAIPEYPQKNASV